MKKVLNKMSKMKIQHQILIIGIIVIIGIVISLASAFYMNYVELKEIGVNYTKTLTKSIYTRGLVFAIMFAFVVVYLYIQNKVIKSILKKFAKEENVEIKNKLPNKSVAFIVAFLLTLDQSQFIYEKIMMYINSTAFTINDPIFNQNIGYYVFQRPLIMQFFSSLSLIMLLITLYVLGYYITAFGSIFNGVKAKSLFKTGFISHNLFNVLIFTSIKIAELFFTKQNVLFSRFMNSGFDIVKQLIGSGFTEINILLNMYRILPILLIVLIVMLLFYYRKKEYKKMIKPIIFFPSIWIFTYFVMIIVQLFYVRPNELALEKKYLQYNIDMTQKAYNISGDSDNVEISNEILKDEIYTNTNLARNVDSMLPEYITSEITTEVQDNGYYSYKNINITTSEIDNKTNITYIVPRQINTDTIKYQNFINKHFKYTHGFGALVLNNSQDRAASLVVNENLTNSVKQPRIYYGTEDENFVVVNSRSIYELDYTKNSNQLVETQYIGSAGIQMNFINKVLMSIKNIEPQILFSNYVDSNSRILINRNVLDRANKVVPFLYLDENPYLLVADDGKLTWVIDAYTTSSNFPYSEYTIIDEKKNTKINYIRNSIKVLVDAYDGTTKVYITDKTDPMAITYEKMFPEIFTNIDDKMYENVKNKFKYPQELFNIQTEILKQYNTKYADSFYRNDNKLDYAKYMDDKNKIKNISSYFSVTKLQDMNKDGLVILQPYTLDKKDNLLGYFAGRVEEGKNILKTYKFTNLSKVLGPKQLDEQMSTDKELQLELKLLKDTRNDILKKEIVVPYNNKILYAQLYFAKPMDTENKEASLEIIVLSDGKRFIVSKGNNIDEAFNKLFSNESGSTISNKVIDSEDMTLAIDSTLKILEDMKTSASQGQWEVFGRDIQRLEQELKKLKTQSEQSKIDSSKTTTTTVTQ